MNESEFGGAEFNGGSSAASVPAARVAAASPLGAAALLVQVIPLARVAAASPLGAPRLLGGMVIPAARVAAASPLGAVAVLAEISLRYAHLYRLSAYISGAENGISDYPIPLISFGLSKRSAAASYYSISAPYSDDLLAALTARPDGIVYILRDGYRWESFNQAHPLRYDLGANNRSISMSGYRQSTAVASAAIAIEPAHAISSGINSEGLLTLDLVPGLLDPRPADVITWDGVDYTVILKKYNARADSQTLSINAEPV